MTLAPFSSRRRRGGTAYLVPQGTRWDPYREMEDINTRFEHLMRTFFGDAAGQSGTSRWSPLAAPVDVEETDDTYKVDVDLPNVDPQDVTIEMKGEELRISGQYRQHERSGVVRRQNRPTGDFEFLVDLPSDIDPDRVDATYDNGVLTITVGKTRDAQPRRIEIHAPQGQQRLGEGDGQADSTQSDATAGTRRDSAQMQSDTQGKAQQSAQPSGAS